MKLAVQLSLALSTVMFLYYGLDCLLAGGMREEFERYGLARFRMLTGALEVAGAAGLLASLSIPVLVVPAAAGLAMLMAGAVLARVRARDPLLEAAPASALMLINVFLAAAGATGVYAV